ncbi:MAG: permease-like cell division protein FtsX [Acidaminococcales bacterium]|jgi:cell division transport system permease protein|nr:permease-like cell division protein FtsX [Acidaminococcales bacterium]
MSLRTKEYFVREAILSIKRNRLMSVASVSTVTISLLILGIFALMIINMNNMANILESQVQVTVYIRDGTDKEGIAALGEEIKKLPGVAKVNFVGKEEALKRFAERLGERKELLDSLGSNNPLPDAYEVHMDSPEQVKAAVSRISQLQHVEETIFGQEVIEQLFSLTRILRVGGVVLIIFLALATLFIISNTIRITVFSRRKEVNIMKYVGATDWFIRWPFLLEGMLLGLAGSLLAVVLLIWLYGMVIDQIHASLAFLPLVPRTPLLYYASGFLIIAGMGIGALGSSISLRKFLQV